MKLKLKYIFIFGLLSLTYSFTSFEDSEVVSVKGRQLRINDTPYFIKGVCFNPVEKGHTERDFTNIDLDLALMNEAGINTIRVYKPIDEVSVLDKIAAAGIKVITSFGYNQEGHFDILTGSYLDYVNTYKSHKAILFWELGNEYNYHPEWFDGDITNWYDSLQIAADAIHQNDPNHPVASAHGELPDSATLAASTNVDLWGLNVYRWDNPEAIFNQWSALSDKPMYLSEAGSDSYMTVANHEFTKGENQQAQAQSLNNILSDVFDNKAINSGVLVFSFTDELWKAGNPDKQDVGGWAPASSGVPYDGTANEEYWGILDVNRHKKDAFHVLKEFYNNPEN
jgi:endo-1,4-beta-mannosidase